MCFGGDDNTTEKRVIVAKSGEPFSNFIKVLAYLVGIKSNLKIATKLLDVTMRTEKPKILEYTFLVVHIPHLANRI